MIIKTALSCLAATLFVGFWRRIHGNYNKRYTNYRSVDCRYNSFFDGNDCAECPNGTYGKNCSNICGSSTYGKFCSGICDCKISLCHRVYGCSAIWSTSEVGRKITIPLTFSDITTTNQEIKTDRKGDTENPQEPRGYSLIDDDIDGILVIASGTLLSLSLLLLIGREIVKLRRSEISNVLMK